MRASFVLLLACLAAPASARSPATDPDPSSVAANPALQAIGDPAVADRVAGTMQVLSEALLNLPAGSVAAAVEGRKPSASERRLTVRDLARRDDPHFDRKVAEQMARARPMVEQSLKALGQALPAVMGSLKQAGEALDRAAANMPDPTYPKR